MTYKAKLILAQLEKRINTPETIILKRDVLTRFPHDSSSVQDIYFWISPKSPANSIGRLNAYSINIFSGMPQNAIRAIREARVGTDGLFLPVYCFNETVGTINTSIERKIQISDPSVLEYIRAGIPAENQNSYANTAEGITYKTGGEGILTRNGWIMIFPNVSSAEEHLSQKSIDPVNSNYLSFQKVPSFKPQKRGFLDKLFG